MKINIGDKFPYFDLADHKGNLFGSASFIGRKAMVVYFYPKNETKGCTKQACSFRDHYQEFMDAGAEVIGISSDSTESHQEFAANHNLPFILLSDPDNAFRKRIEVPRSFLGLVPGRVTYIVDAKGIVTYIFNSQLNVDKHIQIALKTLKDINTKVI